MKIEIDQSGRIADTHLPTVLAFSNGNRYSIYLSPEVKRKVVIELRRHYGGRVFYLKLFTLLIFLLIRKHLPGIKSLYIDREYIGRENEIKEYFLDYCKRYGQLFDSKNIHFTFLGKRSGAHLYAIDCFRNKAAEKTISYKEIINTF